MLGLDYAGGRPGGAAIAAAGYSFVARYLSDGGKTLPGKLLTPAEADDLRAHGVGIVSGWETWADAMLRGTAQGVQDAQAAQAQHNVCGGPPDRPIYFAADWDMQPNQYPVVQAYLDGAASVIGRTRVGIYGSAAACAMALSTGSATWAWQTAAWSAGVLTPGVHIYQRIGYVTVGGVECDVNESLAVDFGQWSLEDDMFNDTDRAWLEDLLRRVQQMHTGGFLPMDLTKVPHWSQGGDLTWFQQQLEGSGSGGFGVDVRWALAILMAKNVTVDPAALAAAIPAAIAQDVANALAARLAAPVTPTATPPAV